ncbi:hypothetical protein EHF33_03245 [Deinococcus psychrotolerans]|uniref:DinB-like domain-containing protein n=1 Tax=Deinococcus psychrotolerans TaxID=2489213 RepID=A0A3G8YFV5_9DEIO|nr:hypothetical protein EHF33_03245 [Deinococcus psychrotolerans]
MGAVLNSLEPPSERSVWLLEHLRETKLEIWALCLAATDRPAPPASLSLLELCRWEVESARSLSAVELGTNAVHAGRTFDVSGLLRQSARHTVWHAGQLAALASSL